MGTMTNEKNLRVVKVTHEEWAKDGVRRFGKDTDKWRFVCPACGHSASVGEYRAAGVPESAVGFSCIGRWSGPKRTAFGRGEGACDYAGGGLFALNPVWITMPDGSTIKAFAFDDAVEGADK